MYFSTERFLGIREHSILKQFKLASKELAELISDDPFAKNYKIYNDCTSKKMAEKLCRLFNADCDFICATTVSCGFFSGKWYINVENLYPSSEEDDDEADEEDEDDDSDDDSEDDEEDDDEEDDEDDDDNEEDDDEADDEEDDSGRVKSVTCVTFFTSLLSNVTTDE